MQQDPSTEKTTSPSESPPRRKLSVRKKVVFAALATFLFLVLMELTLRLIGFRFVTKAPNLVVNGRSVAPMFRHSEFLNWEPIPGEGPFNEDGFAGPRLRIERTPGTPRMATLGDSCTQFGDPPYPTRLCERLAERLGKPVEVLNAGVVGYSTEQGISRLRHKVLPHRPDAVTIYFGWNDHWATNRLTDAQIAEEDAEDWQWLDIVGRSRVVQAGLYGAHMVHERRMWGMMTKPHVLRVPLDRYEHNLRQMIELVRGISAEPILITAPSDVRPETPAMEFTFLKVMSETGYESPKTLHNAYVEATRRVARETGTRLVDAATAFDGRDELFMRDHIHLSPDGISALADLLVDALANTVNEAAGAIPAQAP